LDKNPKVMNLKRDTQDKHRKIFTSAVIRKRILVEIRFLCKR